MPSLLELIMNWALRCWAFLCLAFTPLQAQTAAPVAQGAPVVVASYNVENYLMMPRWVNGHFRSNAGKPASEKTAVANVVAGIHPDIIGFMEIGDTDQFSDLQRHLREVNLNYPYSEYLQGWDPLRHVALLSRFPIVERHSQGTIPLKINGATFYSSRGVLDVTIEVQPGNQLRILCVHLKSKIPVPLYDQAAFRQAEAKALHAYIDTILAATPTMPLLVMGDFNDTKNSQPLLTILGTPNKTNSLTALPLKDNIGETWTEYWDTADEYTRIDYMLVNSELAKEIQYDHSEIARPTFWNAASDHCAIVTTIVPTAPSTPAP